MRFTAKQQEFDRQLDRLAIREFHRNGDLSVLEELYRKYAHLVYGLSLNYLKNREQALAMVTVVFNKFTTEAVKTEIPNLKTWLYVVCKDCCLSELQKSDQSDSRLNHWEIERNAILKNGFELHPIEKGVTALIKKCLGKLTSEQRSIIEWFYIKEKPFREIALLMQTNDNHIRALVQEAKAKLKPCIENENGRQGEL